MKKFLLTIFTFIVILNLLNCSAMKRISSNSEHTAEYLINFFKNIDFSKGISKKIFISCSDDDCNKIKEELLVDINFCIDEDFLWHKNPTFDSLKITENLVVSSHGSSLCVWSNNDIEPSKIEGREFYEHSENINVLAVIDEDSRTIVSASDDKRIAIFRQKIPSNVFCCVQEIGAHASGVHSIIKINKIFFASGSDDGEIKIWKRNFKWQYECVQSFKAHESRVSGLCMYNPDTLISCSFDKTIKIWRKVNGEFKHERTLRGHNEKIIALLAFNAGELLSISEGSLEKKNNKVWYLYNYLSIKQAVLIRALEKALVSNQKIALHANWQSVYIPKILEKRYKGLITAL